tara:strand:- start:101 stop:340 length:240 start_codon:yes stop_codon:yes gene_type:complete
VIVRPSFKKNMSKPNKKKVKKQYLAGTSGKLRARRKAALKRLNKDNKGSGVLPGDKKGGKFVGSKKKSKHNKKFKEMYG